MSAEVADAAAERVEAEPAATDDLTEACPYDRLLSYFQTERRLFMLKIIEMDERVSLHQQMGSAEAPVVLVNVFKVAPEDVDALLAAWTADATLLKSKPGFVSAQLHRGIEGSTTFLNYAVWESVVAFRAAFSDPQFQATLNRYPESTVASPHLFQRVAIPGISEGE